jgi:2-keto-3-deoxy-L-rhamnonate aldolase RhmA
MKFLVLVVVPLVGARVVQTQQQIPIIGSPGNIDATISRPFSLGTTDEWVPTVGVHFTTSYAVASARYQNGTMRDLGKVVGDAAYVDLMSRWAEAKDDGSCD